MTQLSLKHIVQALLAVVVMIAVVWLAFYALIVLLVLGVIGAAVFALRRLLVSQGIIKPRQAAAPSESDASVTVIEAEYTDVTKDDR